jgi:hypothetical protein
MFWGGWFWELHIPINLQGVQSSYASFFCVARVSEILGGWERVITEGWGSVEGIVFGGGKVLGCCGLGWPFLAGFDGDESERLVGSWLPYFGISRWILKLLVGEFYRIRGYMSATRRSKVGRKSLDWEGAWIS